MPRKTEDITIPMSHELLNAIEHELDYGDRRSERIRELIREGLRRDGVPADQIPPETDHRETEGTC